MAFIAYFFRKGLKESMFKVVAGSALLVPGPQQFKPMTFATRVRSLPSLRDT